MASNFSGATGKYQTVGTSNVNEDNGDKILNTGSFIQTKNANVQGDMIAGISSGKFTGKKTHTGDKYKDISGTNVGNKGVGGSISAGDGRASELKSELDEKKSEIKELKNDNAELKNENRELKQEIKELRAENKELRAENKELRKK